MGKDDPYIEATRPKVLQMIILNYHHIERQVLASLVDVQAVSADCLESIQKQTFDSAVSNDR